jgi:phosphatidylglycerophosphate synthase
MIVSKQIADFLTLSRSILSFLFVWLAKDNDPETLPYAIILLLICWITDILDGPLARRSSKKYQNFIGENDILADLMVATGLVIYMVMVGFLHLYIGTAFMIIFLILFFRFGYKESFGMAFQPIVYVYFLWIAFSYAPDYAIWLLVYIFIVTIFSWQRLIKEQIPRFFKGFQDLK